MELDWLQMLLLSIAQGMCGVFPLSEGGFLTILRKLLGLSLDGSSDGLYSAMMQLAVALAVLFFFRRDWLACLSSVSRRAIDPASRTAQRLNRRMLTLILVGAVPMALSVFISVDFLGSLLVGAGTLILDGLVVFLSDRIGKGNRQLPETTLSDGLWIGLAQELSAVMGMSRTSLTVTAGIVRGLSPEFCFRYSFLVGGPVLLVRSCIAVLQAAGGGGFSWPYLIGMAIAGLCGYGAMHLLRWAVRRKSYSIFAYVLWGAGLFSIILYLIS